MFLMGKLRISLFRYLWRNNLAFLLLLNSRDTVPIPDLIGDQSRLLQTRYYAPGISPKVAQSLDKAPRYPRTSPG